MLVAVTAHAAVPPQKLSKPVHAREGARTVTADWLLEAAAPALYATPNLSWIGNSDALIYSIVDRQDQKLAIERLDVRTGTRRRLAEGSSPKISPDGRWVAYAAASGADVPLKVQRLNDGVEREVARFPSTEFYDLTFSWSPDSQRIAVGYRPPFERSWVRDAGDDAQQPTAVDFDAETSKPVDAVLALHDLEGGAPQLLLGAPGTFRDIVWLSRNDILYTRTLDGFERAGGETSTTIGRVNVSDAANVELIKFKGRMDTLSPALSPDRTSLAITTDLDDGSYNIMPSVAILSLRGPAVGTLRRVTHETKMSNPVWAVDGKSLYALRWFGAYPQAYRIDVATGTTQQLTSLSAELQGAPAISRTRIALLTRDAHNRVAVSVSTVDAGGQWKDFREVVEIAPAPRNFRLGETREVGWTAQDGVPSRGVMFLPPDYDAHRHYPLIVDLHGGLSGATVRIAGGALLYNTPLEFHMWAAKGYVVLLPEFRNSGALGERSLRRMKEEGDAYGFHGNEKDIMSGIDSLITAGIVDGKRVAVLGMSGGAAMTNWLVARTRDRFSAAVSCDGFAEVYVFSSVASGAGGLAEAAESFGGWPWEVPGHYLENSAIYHVRGTTTPTLFLMGSTELSGVDPTLSSQFLYTALKRQGIDTRYVRYAKEGHGLFRPANRRDSLMRAIDWVDRHMQ